MSIDMNIHLHMHADLPSSETTKAHDLYVLIYMHIMHLYALYALYDYVQRCEGKSGVELFYIN